MINIIFLLIWLGFCVYLFMRNEHVYKERMKIHDAIFKEHNGNYIRTISEVTYYLSEQDKISTHGKALWTIWKRPKNIYKDLIEKLENENNEKIGELE